MENFFVLLIGGVFIVLGMLVSKFKCYWLIAGYNTMGEEEKKNVEIDKIGKIMGRSLSLIGALIAIGGILSRVYPIIEIIMLIGIVFVLVVMFMRTHKYNHNKGKRAETVFTCAILGVAAMIMIITVAGTTEKNKVEFKEDKIVINNSFGITIYKEEIETVSLLDSMPKILKRTSGASLGYYKKGNFKVEGEKQAKLYLESEAGPFVKVITKNGNIYMNFKEKGEAKAMYLKLREVI